ncbi:hypothetical protein GCM10009741_08680 [Kribbella lupini]|uniref:Uncharacterized protein n=1 Tax=Kribbella lupini TaxID=291602 RepID=A0ABP4KZ88_9ACTN
MNNKLWARADARAQTGWGSQRIDWGVKAESRARSYGSSMTIAASISSTRR